MKQMLNTLNISDFISKCTNYVIVIPWLRGILLIYTPKARGLQARGLRVYMSAKSQAAMVQVIYITWGALT